MKPAPFLIPPRARAFTLIEMLVSMSVLVLLLIMVLQMINGAMSITGDSTKRLDADSQIRLVFDRMAVDFAGIVKRPDVDYYLQKLDTAQTPGTNDQIAFYSETTGYYPAGAATYAKSNAALVGYCINSKSQLLRLNKALVWNGAATTNSAPAMTFLPQTTPSPVPSPYPGALTTVWPLTFPVGSSGPDMTQSTDADYQVLGEQIFRMEVCYLVRDTYNKVIELSDSPYVLPVPGATPAATPNVTSYTPPYPYKGLRDVVAVVVTLAVLDNTSRVIVPSASTPSNLQNAAGKLDNQFKSNTQYAGTAGNPIPAGTTLVNLTPSSSTYNANWTTPARLWQAHVDNGDLVDTGSGTLLPKAAASRVRIYERYFYLGNNQ